jgi:hypothetical protein
LILISQEKLDSLFFCLSLSLFCFKEKLSGVVGEVWGENGAKVGSGAVFDEDVPSGG